MSLPHGAMGWPAVCDYGISWPYSIIFQRQLSIIKFTLNCPPIRNNLTSASLLSMLIETDYLNYPPIRNNLSSASLPDTKQQYLIKCFQSLTRASLLFMLIETDYNFKKITAVFFGSCLKEFHSVWNCPLIKQNAKLFQHNHLLFEICWGYLFCSIHYSGSARVTHFTRLCLKAVTEPNSA